MDRPASPRRWPRAAAPVAAALAVLALAAWFAALNRPQPIELDFGVWMWRGEAVHAVFGAAFLGLVTMFFLSLPADLKARAEMRRLAGRTRALERELDGERAAAIRSTQHRDDDEPDLDAPRRATAAEP
jgi:hypothetical protein